MLILELFGVGSAVQVESVHNILLIPSFYLKYDM